MHDQPTTARPVNPNPPWALFLAVLAGLYLVLVVNIAGPLAAVLSGRSWPKIVGDPLDVALAVLTGGSGWRPPPPGWLTWCLLIVLWLGPVALAGWWVLRRALSRTAGPSAARWASAADERRLAVPDNVGERPCRLVAGRGLRSRRLLAAEDCISAVAFGPNGSGKTAGLVAPNAIEWAGPLLLTTTKPQDVPMVHAARAAAGPVWIVAPGGCPGHSTARWSPVDYATDLPAADRMADWLVEASGMTVDPKARSWNAQARKYLAPLLLAAHLSGRGVEGFVEWIYDGEQAADEVEALLAAHGQVEARRLYHSTWTIHDEGKGSVLFTAYGLADVYARPDVRAAAARSDFRPEELLSGRPATLILVAPESDADRLAPYFTALTAAVVHAAEIRAGRTGEPLSPRLGLLLDEAGNMFRFPRLTNLLTTARGNGIQLLLIYHDMAQLEHLYGRTGARTVLSNAKLRMLLPGQGDTETLRYFSTLLGRTLVNRGGLSRNHAGYQSRSTSEQLEELAPVHLLQQIPDGQAVVQYTNLPPVRVRLRMCFRDKAVLAASQAEQAPTIVAPS